MAHKLTNKDKVELLADCSECGARVPIRLNGRYGVVCVEARRQSNQKASQNYKQAHPDRVQRQKAASNPSTHRLTLRNGDLDTCAECGEVQPVRWGRGWMCPTIPKERGWSVSETKNIRPRPIDPLLREELFAAGMHVESGPSPLSDEIENAVPGWVTLGPPATKQGTAHYSDPWRGRQVYVMPAYAELYGSGSRV